MRLAWPAGIRKFQWCNPSRPLLRCFRVLIVVIYTFQEQTCNNNFVANRCMSVQGRSVTSKGKGRGLRASTNTRFQLSIDADTLMAAKKRAVELGLDVNQYIGSLVRSDIVRGGPIELRPVLPITPAQRARMRSPVLSLVELPFDQFYELLKSGAHEPPMPVELTEKNRKRWVSALKNLVLTDPTRPEDGIVLQHIDRLERDQLIALGGLIETRFPVAATPELDEEVK